MDDMLVAFKANPLLQIIDDATLAKAAEHGSWLNLRKGRRVLIEGKCPDGVYVLVEGGVRIQLAGPNDETLLARLFSAPAFFGECDVLSHVPWMQTVVTAVDSKLIFIPTLAFEEMLAASPAFTTALLRDVAKRLMLTAELGRQLAFGDVESRVARYLLDYAEILGKPVGEGLQIAAELSQRSIAQELAISRRVVQEAITTLIRDGVVEKDGKHLVIRDRVKLRLLAGPFVQALGHRIPSA